jgi:S-formylglutathione hydrolase FrmB
MFWILIYSLFLFSWSTEGEPREYCYFLEGAPEDTSVHFLKDVVNESTDPRCYLVLHPSQDSDPLPMIVLLHGLGDSAEGLARSSIVKKLRIEMKRGRFPLSIIVIPEGQKGYWTNWINAENSSSDVHYEERLLQMISEAQQQYPVLSDKVAIVGVSMGGFGALSIGLRHPDKFSAIVAMSPTDMEIAVQRQPENSLYTNIYGSPVDMSYVYSLNPKELLLQGAGKDQMIAWVYGTAEPDKFKLGAERLQQAAKSNGLNPQVRIIQGGGHSFTQTWGGETIDWWMGLVLEWFEKSESTK